MRSSAPVVSRCFPGGYNVKLYISNGRLAWWFLAFLHSECNRGRNRSIPKVGHQPHCVKYGETTVIWCSANKILLLKIVSMLLSSAVTKMGETY